MILPSFIGQCCKGRFFIDVAGGIATGIVPCAVSQQHCCGSHTCTAVTLFNNRQYALWEPAFNHYTAT